MKNYEAFMVNTPIAENRKGGLPSGLLKRLHAKGLSPKAAFKEAWRQVKRGRKNPELMIVNKKRKKGGVKKMAKRRSLSVIGRRGRLRVARRSRLAPGFARRHTLINPLADMGLSFGENRRKVRRYRRNDMGLGISNPFGGGIVKRLSSVAVDSVGVSVGFIGVKVIPNYVLPVNWRSGVLGYAGKLVTAVVLSMILGKVAGRKWGELAMLGGGVAIITELAGGLMLRVGATVGDVASIGAYVPELSAYVERQ